MNIIIKVVDIPTGRLIEKFRFPFTPHTRRINKILARYTQQLFKIEITFDYPAGTFDSAS